MSNYPPGVTGNEPQLAGSSWQTWLEHLTPGDPVWHVDGRQGILTEMHDDCMIVMCAGGSDLWAHEDTEQPRTTAFDIWAAAQGEEE